MPGGDGRPKEFRFVGSGSTRPEARDPSEERFAFERSVIERDSDETSAEKFAVGAFAESGFRKASFFRNPGFRLWASGVGKHFPDGWRPSEKVRLKAWLDVHGLRCGRTALDPVAGRFAVEASFGTRARREAGVGEASAAW